MNFTQLFFSCRGRIGRLTFGLTTAALLAVNALLAGLFQLIGLPMLAIVATLAICYPTWALSIKRAHDIGKSGWWLFGWTFSPLLALGGLALIVLSGATADNLAVAALLYVSMMPLSGVSARTVYKLGFVDGQPGANAYGQTMPFLRHLFNSDEEFMPPAAAVASTPVRVQTDVKPAATAPRTAPSKGKPGGFGRRGFNPA